MDKLSSKSSDVFAANRDRAAPLLAQLKAEGIGHRIDGKVVEPGTIELRSGSIVGALPGSLIAVLVLLAVAAAALGGRAARNHARARRPQ